MKTVKKLFILVLVILIVTSCKSKEIKTDVSMVEYVEVIDDESIAKNIELASNQIKSFKITGEMIFKDKKYTFDGEVILNKKILNSIAHIKINKADFYLKNSNGYVSYYYEGTNFIIKDDIRSFIKEIVGYLDRNDVQVDDKKIMSLVEGNFIENIDYMDLARKMKDGYLISNFSNLEVHFKDNYLVDYIEYQGDNMMISIDFEYDPISINIPLGYDIATLKIDFMKNLLKIDNIISLLK